MTVQHTIYLDSRNLLYLFDNDFPSHLFRTYYSKAYTYKNVSLVESDLYGKEYALLVLSTPDILNRFSSQFTLKRITYISGQKKNVVDADQLTPDRN